MNNINLPLNKTQVEILKLFTQPMSEEELQDIKQLLVNHLSNKLSGKIEKISRQKGYTQKDFDNWLNELEQ